MILYFDSLITDVPLSGKGSDSLKEDIRKNTKIYSYPKKLDIAKYTLASYSSINWNHVLIKYELDNTNEYSDMDRYIKKLFPRATILHKRSANQNEYIKSLSLLNKMNDEWIFYAPNNDHPLLYSSEDVNEYLDHLIHVAKKWRSKYKYSSIMYSHISEFLNIPVKGTPEHFLHGKNTKVIEENASERVYVTPNGDFSSIQIVHISLLNYWFNSMKLGNQRIIRAEDLNGKIKIKDQVIVVPKKELCAHFDGYEHMLGRPNEIQTDLVPPLFIPPRFFSGGIKISYGYDKHLGDYVNINPCAKKYSFRDSENGTDLKIALNDVPLFWKPRIKEVKVNKKISKRMLNFCAKKNQLIKENPWEIKYQKVSYKLIIQKIRFYGFVSWVGARSALSIFKKKLFSL